MHFPAATDTIDKVVACQRLRRGVLFLNGAGLRPLLASPKGRGERGQTPGSVAGWRGVGLGGL